MSTDLVVGILGGGGIASIVAAVVAGLFSKRKLGAEATEIITKAASGVVERLEAEVISVRKDRENAILQHRLDMATIMESHDQEMEEVRRVLQLHVAWDAIAIARLGELGVDLPAAPPLLPAQRHGRPRFD